jgi:hypothetical protein
MVFNLFGMFSDLSLQNPDKNKKLHELLQGLLKPDPKKHLLASGAKEMIEKW